MASVTSDTAAGRPPRRPTPQFKPMPYKNSIDEEKKKIVKEKRGIKSAKIVHRFAKQAVKAAFAMTTAGAAVSTVSAPTRAGAASVGEIPITLVVDAMADDACVDTAGTLRFAQFGWK